ncbi:uncharacterized protein [Argopecten irradians]|uniref:uncharacterized protein n=1 Tax=Argopecten irradians TaxID=31199 RepID=UPI0037177033
MLCTILSNVEFRPPLGTFQVLCLVFTTVFKDSPARHEDYQKVCGSSVLPLKFVNHRWMENVGVVERALLIWKNIETYVKKVQEKEVNKPTCKSYEVVATMVKDPLVKAKMEFFRYIATHLQPFLGHYQTDRPMVPFLMADLGQLVRGLMSKVIKDDVMKEIGPESTQKLFALDIDDKKNQVTYSKVDLGFSAAKELRQAKVSDKQSMEFKLQSKDFVLATLRKIMMKSPATYSVVRYLSMLNPKEMVSNPSLCKSRLKKCLGHFVSCGRVNERDCDCIIQQYDALLLNIPSIGTSMFADFNPYLDRLDEFLMTHLKNQEFEKLRSFVKLCLVLSHGQADVERGFSVNKKVEVENLKEESVVAQRLICDYVKNVGGIKK